jgi:putative endonuclease
MARWLLCPPSFSDDPSALGRAAERGACRYLRRRGLRLIERNWRCRRGELDLVMRESSTIVFVEVRLRASTAWEHGAESVGSRKRRRLVRAAAAFLAAHHEFAELAARFDVVSVTRRHYRLRYEWIRDAFTP